MLNALKEELKQLQELKKIATVDMKNEKLALEAKTLQEKITQFENEPIWQRFKP